MPQPTIQYEDPAFRRILPEGTPVEVVAHAPAHEGPVYIKEDDSLLFTTTPTSDFRVQIQRVDLASGTVSVWREDTNMANGMTLDAEGRLLICEQGRFGVPARISRAVLPRGTPETLVESWSGLPFNSPNDVVVKRSDSSVWFTDPSYGSLQGFKTKPRVGDFVYRYDAVTRRISVVADGFSKPNGLAFSPDERILYVTDSGAIQAPGSYHVDLPHHVVAFDVVNERHLAQRRLFAVTTPGIPDGIKLDVHGNVYLGCGDGVQVFDARGDLLGKILVDGGVANLTFGGPGGNVLYLCADPLILAVRLETRGAGL